MKKFIVSDNEKLAFLVENSDELKVALNTLKGKPLLHLHQIIPISFIAPGSSKNEDMAYKAITQITLFNLN